MALKLDPVRLLIADDVGIGKTVEACLIARELLDRGEIQRLAVLCPPHSGRTMAGRTARQVPHRGRAGPCPAPSPGWSATCGSGSRSSTVTRSSSSPRTSSSPDRRRDEFVRACPEFVIVDEAHTCAFAADQRQRAAPAPPAAAGARRGSEASPHARHRHSPQRQRGGLPFTAGAAAT